MCAAVATPIGIFISVHRVQKVCSAHDFRIFIRSSIFQNKAIILAKLRLTHNDLVKSHGICKPTFAAVCHALDFAYKIPSQVWAIQQQAQFRNTDRLNGFANQIKSKNFFCENRFVAFTSLNLFFFLFSSRFCVVVPNSVEMVNINFFTSYQNLCEMEMAETSKN